MSSIDATFPRPDHPWLAEFEAEPRRAFDSLIRGVSVPYPYSRGEPREVLALLFGALAERDPLNALLDETLGAWLDERRKDRPEWRSEYGVERYIQELSDALHLVYRLDLSGTAKRLADGYFGYMSWVRSLRLNSARDAGREYLNVLAHSQTDRRFQSCWVLLCEEAARERRPDLLPVGLLGLRSLPVGDKPEPLDAALSGLARWGALLGEQDHVRFRRQWRALRALYPRGPEAWNERVLPLLKGRTEPFADWWRADLPKTKGNRRTAAAIEPPPRRRRESIEGRIGREPIEAVRTDILELIADQRRYAEVTGISHFLVRTACNIGAKVRDAAPDLAYELARTAVQWEPGHPYGWTLWAESLVVLGQNDLAELLLWETIRRFPDDVVSRSGLAELLARTGREVEAEALYRDTIRRFPDNAVSRNGLAELLARTGREGEAEALYRDTIAKFRQNEICRRALACLFIRQERYGEAEELIPGIDRLDPGSGRSIRAALARAQNGEAPFSKHDAEAPVQPGGVHDEEAAALGDEGLVARSRFRLSPALSVLDDGEERDRLRRAAKDDLDDVLRRRPDHAGAALLVMMDADRVAAEEDRAARWAPLAQAFPGDYGLALAAARRMRDASAFQRLLKDVPTRAPVTRLARLEASVAEPDDASFVVDWLEARTESQVEGDPVALFIWRKLHQWMEQPGGPAGDFAGMLARRSADLDALLDDAAFAAVQDAVPLMVA